MHPSRLGIAMVVLLSLLAQAMPSNAATAQDALASAVNSYRASRGLPTVVASPTLQAAAQFMAENVATYGPPAVPHRSTDGRMPQQRMADAGYPAYSTQTAEIIAWGALDAAGAIKLWHNSPAHYAVLNDPVYRAAGFGVACWGAYPCVWVVTFGTVVDRTFTASVPQAPTYHAAFHTQSAFPVASPGQRVQWVVAFTNTGTGGWTAGTELHLGTAEPIDGASRLASSSWLTVNRPARQTTGYVAPGQQAWFIVELAAPMQPGTYRLRLRPVIDGLAWLEDSGAYVDLTVR
ncbi:MAG TPA: CAP domain-containing protein [Candidatus Limnocylindria bacterium]|nr:CAP domain-containing protein [Candidatus Limnocylindria bacterium]